MKDSYRLLELDVLRGLAALTVVGYHYTTRFDQLYGHSERLVVRFPLGHYALQLFFMISGFAIFMTIERTRDASAFVISRLSRLFPAYWVAIILTFSIVSMVGLPGREVSITAAITNLSMLQSFIGMPHVDGVYWTLAVELTFYTIMVGLYKAKLLRRIEAVGVLWVLLMTLGGVLHLIGFTVPTLIRRLLILEYANVFVSGIIFYRIMKEGPSVNRYVILGLCLLAQRVVSGWEATLAIALFFLTFQALIRGKLSFIVSRPLIFLGATTYALYLVHQNIGYIVIRALYVKSVNPNLSVIIATIVSLSMAIALTFLVEQRMVSGLRRLFRSSLKIYVSRPREQATTGD